MMKKAAAPQGKYIYSGDKQALKKSRLIRSVLYGVMLLCFILPPLVLKQAALKSWTDAQNNSLPMAYAIMYFFVALWLVVSFILSFTRYALRETILKSDEPKLGFEKHTWSVIEWQFYILTIAAVIHLAMAVYAFSLSSLFVVMLIAGAAVAAYFIKDISLKAYRGKLNYVPLEDELKASPDNETATPPEKQETNLKTYSPDARKNLSEEVEDFYDKD